MMLSWFILNTRNFKDKSKFYDSKDNIQDSIRVYLKDDIALYLSCILKAKKLKNKQ